MAGLALDTYHEDTSVVKARKTWEYIVRRVHSGEMPPKTRPRPPASELEAFIQSVNGVIARSDRAAKTDPGHVTVCRLNRTEYNNTVRDLVGIDGNPAEDFPADEVGYGFDNIGDVLSLSPILLERYLAAAEVILHRAVLVGEPPRPPLRQRPAAFLKPPPKERYGQPFRGLNAKGDLSTIYELTVAGEYKFRTCVWGRQVGDEAVKIGLIVNGKQVHYDQPAIERIFAAQDQNGYRFSALVVEVVKSEPFRLRRGKEQK